MSSDMLHALAILLIATIGVSSAPSDPESDLWYTGPGEEPGITLYFVYSTTCPHCREAHPFVDSMAETRPWLEVVPLEVNTDPEAAQTAIDLGESIGQQVRVVPTFLFCEQMTTGFDRAETTGVMLEQAIDACRADRPLPVEPEEEVDVPVLGTISSESLPLPVFTVVVAALDAFNPCAFFVLLFLLSLLVHTRSRRRMAAIGSTFIFVSGALYFVFLAAWLNVFAVAGHLRAVTLGAGAVAIVLGLFNVKDYALSSRGPSLSIPERAKPGLFARMRTLTLSERLVPMMGATVLLAVAANSYELLCTAGLPMVFTRVLTLNELPQATYYGYIGLYSVVYILPLLAIVGGFVAVFSSRKLLPEEGRALKLLSGSMMLGLGGVLLAAPDRLTDIGSALVVVGASVGVTALVLLIRRMMGRRRPRSATPDRPSPRRNSRADGPATPAKS